MLDLIIRSDRVVTPHGVGEYEIGIQNGRIVSMAVPGAVTKEAGRIIDARGLKASSCVCYQIVKTVYDRAQK